jgi:hypothetical protein
MENSLPSQKSPGLWLTTDTNDRVRTAIREIFRQINPHLHPEPQRPDGEGGDQLLVQLEQGILRGLHCSSNPFHPITVASM